MPLDGMRDQTIPLLVSGQPARRACGERAAGSFIALRGILPAGVGALPEKRRTPGMIARNRTGVHKVSTSKAELTPRGVMRVGLNMSNFLLVAESPSGGAPTGIVPDLAAKLAARLGVDIEWVRYRDAGLLSADAKGDPGEDAWDVAFMGAEPARARVIAFTPAYVEIEAGYMVPAESPIKSIDEVDRPGVRIAVAARAAYALYLARTLQHAELVTAEGLEGSFTLFGERKLEVLAGLKSRLIQDQARMPGTRVLPGRFTAVQQAIATPAGRPAALALLNEYAEEIKADGTVAELIARHRIEGLSVAPPSAK
jgi:polar amino acid transport system substrate-binding protein